MSILIKGMEIPQSCISCSLNFGEKRPEYGLTIYCPYSDGVISWRDKAFDNGRLASCGIIPVPTPHGRLIDANALLKTNYGPFGAIDEIAREAIANAPTIIPAEEEIQNGRNES